MRNVALVVTGASRGLGREIAKAFLDDPSSTFSIKHTSLLARSIDGLNATKRELFQCALSRGYDGTQDTPNQSSRSREPRFSVSLHCVDLCLLDTLDESLDRLLQSIDESSCVFDELILVNNAGSLGHIGPCTDIPSLQNLRQAVDLNVTSSLWVSVRLARFAMERCVRATIVNISSLVAQEPFPTLGTYSAGKAARDSFHAAMAKEGATDCDVRYLNYAPGPLETDMTEEIRAATGLDPQLRPHYERQLVDPKESARVLVELIRDMEFASGAHIDYYDAM